MTEKLEYNPLSGWVKKGGVRQGHQVRHARVIVVDSNDESLAGKRVSQNKRSGKIVHEDKWIWAQQTAMDPVGEIIHLNGDKFDNRWKNLRTQDQMLVEANVDKINNKDSSDYRNAFQKQFRINYETGEVIDRDMSCSSTKMSDDRPVLFFAGQWFSAEDVVYFMATGVWPERGVVMVNGDFCDLSLSNLRRVV